MQETAQSSTVDSGTRRRGRLPVLTVAVLAVTVAVTVVAHSRPAVFHALRRDPHALRSGQWWRLLSPVLVQADRPALAAGTFVLVFLVGAFFEWRFGRARWLLLYLVGAVSGHAIGHLWQPYGAGCSVGGCGLLGGILAWLLRRGPAPARVGAVMWLLFAVADTVFRDIHGIPILAGTLVGLLVMPRPRR